MSETWKPIPGFPGYEVSDHGRVRSFKRDKPRILKSSEGTEGYPSVNLYVGKKMYRRRIHQLVMLAFVGPRPDGLVVCHNDSAPNNNHLSNLRYDTPAGNVQDAIKIGSMGGPLTAKQIRTIRAEYGNGTTQRALACKFDTSPEVIRGIIAGRTYRHVPGQIFEPFEPIHKRARKIREQYASGKFSLSQLANKHSMDPSGVSRIINGNRCPDAGGPIKGIDY